MLVDTDVLIWHLRGYPKATQRLDQLPKLVLSAVTYLELLQGMRNRSEQRALQKSLALRQAERLPLTPAITERAILLMEKLALSHGLQLGDALIAATGIEHQLTLLTANTKHFSVVDGLQLERFEPGEPAP
ncbi:MAG: type II toxin-antitoxin system VapC family toxin [Candidatus Competibacteraceae bacterium]|nr:MAG: type II toxin-antitoxin system VapC family toxin [Candidatus Competibacteraceae bacterium]